MPKIPGHSRAIDRGLAYIAEQQLENGGLESFSSPSAKHFKPELTYRTTFVPALVLSALAGPNIPGAQPIRERLAAFLVDQASPAWSFNYWAKRTPQRRLQPYPNDLDDTFCALTGLFLHDPKLINQPVLAQAVKLLLATETTVGGPYRTWLVPDSAAAAWLDTDLAVNSNIAYFLSLASQPLPNITDFIDHALVTGDLTSRYYPSAVPIAYYMARGYSGQQASTLVKTLEDLLSSASTALDTALCLSSLLRMGAGRQHIGAIKHLIALQAKDGSWPADAFCLDPAIDSKPYYHGAAVLTTALALETLQLYRQASTKPLSTSGPKPADAGTYVPWVPVLALADSQNQHLAPELRSTVIKSLRQLAVSKNGPEIIGLPQRFNQGLRKPLQPPTNNFFEMLSLANVYGWSAYTIYDDFLDGEGQPALLPSANLAMRRSLSCFNAALPHKRSFQALTRRVFDTIDSANAWEQTHCRLAVKGTRKRQLLVGVLPDYGDLRQLAERSLGHTLAPLAVLVAGGLGPTSSAFRQIQRGLQYYLIVRQLNDDAHDWQTDLTNGHTSYVVTRLLSELNVTTGSHQLPELLQQAQKQFWHATLPAICQEMERHISLSREALSQSGLLVPDNVINQLLTSLEASTQKAMTTRHQAAEFLRHYSRKATPQ